MTTLASKSELNLPYSLAPSYLWLLVVVHCAAMLAVLWMPFETWASVLFLVLVVANGLWAWRGVWKLRSLTCVSFREGAWWVTLGDNQIAAQPYKTPFVLSWLTLVYLRTGADRWVIPFMKGSTEDDLFRRLRIVLLAR